MNRAGTEVILEDGFESGDDFIAEIKPCVAKITPIAKRGNQDYYQEEEKENNFNENISLETVAAYPTVEIDDYIIIERNGLEKVEYMVVSMDGKIINQGQYQTSNFHFEQKIELQNISNGIYLLNIQSVNQSKTIKLIKK